MLCSRESRRQAHRRRSQPPTPPTGRTSKGTILRTALRARRAVQQLVSVLAARLAGGALEDASIHVRGAVRTCDLHAVAVHEDLHADIGHALGREGVFAPRVADLAVAELRVAVDSRPGPGRAGREGKCDGGA
jgi:hypothetical protein